MFPTLQDALSKPEFEQVMRRLPPAKAESWREFCTICEVLQAMKEAEYPGRFGFLSQSIEYWHWLWRSARPIGENYGTICLSTWIYVTGGLQRMTLKLLGQILRFRSPSSV
jgi:hypothetical protein